MSLYITLLFSAILLLGSQKVMNDIKPVGIKKIKEDSGAHPEIQGVYSYNTNDLSKTITILLDKKGDKYFYSLKTPVRNLNGIAEVSTDEEMNTYILLRNIEWQISVCDTMDTEESSDIKNEIPIPTGIELLYDNTNLILQNGMRDSRFVPIPECCEYNIFFIKQ